MYTHGVCVVFVSNLLSAPKHHAQSVKMALTEDLTQNNTQSVSVHCVFLIVHGITSGVIEVYFERMILRYLHLLLQPAQKHYV